MPAEICASAGFELECELKLEFELGFVFGVCIWGLGLAIPAKPKLNPQKVLQHS